MKILIANWIYNWGSTGYIMRDLLDELTRMGHEVIVATAESCDKEDPKVRIFTNSSEWKWFWRMHRLGMPKFCGSRAATKRLIRLIEAESPDVVNLHLLHSNRLNLYSLLKYLGQHGINTVVTNHAELYYTGTCGHAYNCNRWKESQCKGCPDKKKATDAFIFGNPHSNWKLMQKSFSYFKSNKLFFTAVSPWVKERLLQSPITSGFKCEVVLNGLDTNTFYPRANKQTIVKRLGTCDYILHVTACFDPVSMNNLKGGYYIIKLAEAMPEQKFVVVATSMSNTESLPSNVFLWGKAKDQNELAELYSAACMTVLVSRRETFSMVTAESLCCGAPVVGFEAGGPESIAIPEYSKFVKQRDLDGLEKAIKKMLTKEFNRQTISELARDKYSSVTMANGYLKVYEQILKQD